jgi:hypothetical protein
MLGACSPIRFKAKQMDKVVFPKRVIYVRMRYAD